MRKPFGQPAKKGGGDSRRKGIVALKRVNESGAQYRAGGFQQCVRQPQQQGRAKRVLQTLKARDKDINPLGRINIALL